MNITIRPYEEKDAPRLQEMCATLIDSMAQIDTHHLFRSKKELDAVWYTKALQEKLKDAQGQIFFASSGNTLIGHVVCLMEKQDTFNTIYKVAYIAGVIDALFIEKAWKGKGVGSLLMKQAEKYLKNLGATHVALGCIANNDEAREFYEKIGYRQQYIDYLKPLV